MNTNDYILTLSGRNVFREVDLSSGVERVRVGTTSHCDVRFRRELFFEPFELELNYDDGGWTLVCNTDQVYLSSDNIMRRMYQRLEHGMSVDIRYASSGTTLFTAMFSIDFEKERGSYDRIIDCTRTESLSIGGRTGCNLFLNSNYTANDLIVITRDQHGFILTEESTRFGTFLDGRRMMGSVRLPDKTFFSVANFYFYFDAGQLRCSKTANITFSGVAFSDEESRCATSVYPLFNRNTRIKSVMDDEKIPILDPPSPPTRPRGNLIIQLLPALMMLAMTVGMRYFMSGNSNLTYMIMSAVMMSIGVLTSVFGIVSERRGYRRACEARVRKYEKYIESKRDDIERSRDEELAVLRKRYFSLDEEVGMVQEFSGDLFNRRPGDEDFLHVRLGDGPRESVKQLDFKERERLETDSLAELPGQLYQEYRFIQNAPISVSFANNGAIGVVGNDAQLHDILKNMVIDVVTRHYPTEVKIFFITQSENERYIHWARSLPHVQNDELGRRNIVCDEESRNVLFEYLYKELSTRRSQEGKVVPLPRFVIFALDEWGIKNHPLSRFIDGAEGLGTTFVFFEGYKEYLPQGCRRVITVDRDGSGMVVSSENDRRSSHFTYGSIDDYSAWMVAQTLAPVYSEEVSLEGTLTTSFSLYEMLGIISADDLKFEKRWESSLVYRSIAAPIGVSKAGLVELDLSDKADGPHGLVAGTTGSGKSETLLTYLVSVASLYHPHEVAFMIIDFKGGGMAYQLRHLPHLVGTITNIDGREIDRSLKSIRAELQKRQRLFADAGVNHIDAYIRKKKSGDVEIPLPHLVIVVDEFAELKADQPEFMAELVSAARIGRSLGVHLILATQKPAGQVSEQIWTNSRFKLCLKVQSQEDSNEVLKSPLAAEIKEPGRAYIQVGNNERFELFQSAYSGGPEHQDDEDIHEFTLYRVESSGRRIPIFDRKKKESDEIVTTQLDAIVNEMSRQCASAGIMQLPSICLPPLPEVIGYQSQRRRLGEPVALGIYDDPDRQFQGAALFDIDNANTFIVGSSQTGKTNLLETIVRVIAESTTPEESAIYIMDFSAMILRNFEGLNHVGGVVISSEEERMKNLFKLLNQEIAIRKTRLLEVGVSSFSAYLDAGHTDLPHIYVILDNFAVFRELYGERYDEAFVTLSREGLTYGLSLIVTNTSTSGFGYRYLSNFSNGIAFTCNDSAEYSALFDRCKLEPRNVAGRAICSYDKKVFEFQTYLGFEGKLEIDRSNAMRAFVEKCNSRYAGMEARRIPSVPKDLSLDYIRKNYRLSSDKMALALSYETVEPVTIDLVNQFQFALVGDRDGMRSIYLNTLMAEISHRKIEGLGPEVQLHIVDNLQRELVKWKDASGIAAYHGDYNDIDLIIGDVDAICEERYERLKAEGASSLEHDPYIIVIVNSMDALKRIAELPEVQNQYERMASRAKGMRVTFVFSEIPDEPVSYSSPALIKEIRDSRRALQFTNMSEAKFFDYTGTQIREFRAPLESCEAFFLQGSDVSKVRVAAS